jgi:HlyD family secretion protein
MNFAAARFSVVSARRLASTSVAATIALAIAAGGDRAPVAAESAAMAVTVVKTDTACFYESIKLTGVVVARDEAVVRPDVEGYHVTKILAEDGDVVTAGQSLLELAKPSWNPAPLPATAVVKASAAGILVAPRPVPIGVPVSARADPLFRIIRNGEFDLLLDIPQAYLGRIRKDQSARIETLNAADINGVVNTPSPDIDFISQTGHARVRIKEGTPNLRAGTFAVAYIDIDQSCDNISVPLSAVLYRPGRQNRAPEAIVHVVQNGHVETRVVECGLLSGKNIEIRSGLKRGDLVVVRAGAFLNERDPVRTILIDPRDSNR